MDFLVTIAFAAMIAAAAVFAFRALRGKGGFGGAATASKGFAEGTLTVTGGTVGEPDRNGDRNATFTGTIIGDSCPPTEIYGRLVVKEGGLVPEAGQEYPVVYKPGKVDSSWRLGSLADDQPREGG